jgi:hypothetical protein
VDVIIRENSYLGFLPTASAASGRETMPKPAVVEQ